MSIALMAKTLEEADKQWLLQNLQDETAPAFVLQLEPPKNCFPKRRKKWQKKVCGV